ncbi:MAG: hypothetical protein R6U66_03415 [Bacteroidales bacterium]
MRLRKAGSLVVEGYQQNQALQRKVLSWCGLWNIVSERFQEMVCD